MKNSVDRANEIIRKKHLGGLDSDLTNLVKHTGNNYGHVESQWYKAIAKYTTWLDDEKERVPEAELKTMLEERVRDLLGNNCVDCARVAKYLVDKYNLKD
jgi:hypothetical protein